MPTKREREYYRMGYEDGLKSDIFGSKGPNREVKTLEQLRSPAVTERMLLSTVSGTRKRKLSAWNKFVKANSRKPRFIYKSRSNKGKLNLKKMGVAFRKTPAGKRKK